MVKIASALALVACCGTSFAHAEDAPYAEYRYVRITGQIEIACGFMDRPSDSARGFARFERTGFLILETKTPRTFSRTEHVGTHAVLTTISLQPPVGHGEGGASSFADVRIAIDGRVLVDAPLVRGWGGIDRIMVDPTRKFVTVAGHEGIVRYEGFESSRVVDELWLANQARTVRDLIRKP